MAFGAFSKGFKGGFGKGTAAGGGCGGGGGGGGGGFCEEDRSRDWQCPNNSCRERNFVKRAMCFKCGTSRPAEDARRASQPPPTSGTTLHGMVKSYNKKGFGFIMCTGNSDIQDLYFTRENVSSRLLHPDMPGERVTFEIGYEGRRMVARNVRPFGEDRHTQAAMVANSHKARYERGYDEEDTSRDWNCPSCNERNFLKRNVCFKCQTPKPIAEDPPGGPAAATAPAPRRTLSPHAGARAIREALAAARGAPAEKEAGSEESSSPSSAKKKQRKKHKKRKKSSSGSSSSSRTKKKAKRSHKKSKHRGSSSSGDSAKSSKSRSKSSSSGCVMEEPAVQPSAPAGGNPDIDKAKDEALKQLLKLKSVESKEQRMKEWRELLRHWHPDKNPHRIEVATAVFQFLQKGKPMLEGA